MRTFGTDRPRALVLALVLGLYLVSLALPALLFDRQSPVYGITLLFWGWWGVLFLDFAWFANFMFFASAWYFWRGNFRECMGCAGAALGFGAFSLLARTWYFNEGGGTPIRALGPAFYAWMAAFALLLAAAVVHARKTRIPA